MDGEGWDALMKLECPCGRVWVADAWASELGEDETVRVAMREDIVCPDCGALETARPLSIEVWSEPRVILFIETWEKREVRDAVRGDLPSET